jgi:predicted AAA+ superfamily ATPase
MLNTEQENAMMYIKSGHNVYIGGVAGTGKSYMVKAIIE